MPYLRALRRGMWVLALAAILGAALGWVTGSESPNAASATKYYRATAKLMYSGMGEGDQQSSAFTLPQVALRATTGVVLDTVASDLGTTPSQLKRQLAAYINTSDNTISIVGVSEIAPYAVRISKGAADALVRQLPEIAKESQTRQVDQLNSNLNKLQAKEVATQGAIAAELDPVKAATLSSDLAVTQAQIKSVQSLIDNFQFTNFSLSLQQVTAPTATQIGKAEFTGWGDFAVGGMQALAKANQTTDPNGARTGSGAPVFTQLQPPVPRPTRAALGAIIAMLLAAGAILVLYRLDGRLRSKYEVADAFGVDVIAEIPPMSRSEQRTTVVASHREPRGNFAEAYRGLRTSVEFVGSVPRDMSSIHLDFTGQEATGNPTNGTSDGLTTEPVKGESENPQQAKVILVTSALPAEGKTVTVANLATVLAESGASVLVVNCDYRRPQIANYLIPADGANRATQATTDGRPVVRASIVPGVKLVTGIGEQDASANPTEVALLQRRVIELARTRFDYILLDTAPMLTTNDASEILPETDLVILVCRSGKTKRDSAERLSELLHRFGAPVLGVVFTDSEESPGAKYSYYYHEGSDVPHTPVPSVDSVSLEL